MSSHRFQTKKFLVSIGIDRPLGHVFATVLDKAGKPARGFQHFIEYPMTKGGICEAVDSINAFIRKSEPSWEFPSVVIENLHDDLEIFLDRDGDIGGLHVYKSQSD